MLHTKVKLQNGKTVIPYLVEGVEAFCFNAQGETEVYSVTEIVNAKKAKEKKSEKLVVATPVYIEDQIFEQQNQIEEEVFEEDLDEGEVELEDQNPDTTTDTTTDTTPEEDPNTETQVINPGIDDEDYI